VDIEHEHYRYFLTTRIPEQAPPRRPMLAINPQLPGPRGERDSYGGVHTNSSQDGRGLSAGGDRREILRFGIRDRDTMAKLIGDKPLTNAEKCRRYRAKKRATWLASLSEERRLRNHSGRAVKDRS
jgi:hypothetical protein